MLAQSVKIRVLATFGALSTVAVLASGCAQTAQPEPTETNTPQPTSATDMSQSPVAEETTAKPEPSPLCTQYYRVIKGDDELLAPRVHVFQWLAVPGYVDRQQVWMTGDGTQTLNKDEAGWFEMDQTQVEETFGRGWQATEPEEALVQEATEDTYEYIKLGAYGTYEFTSNVNDATWITTDDAIRYDIRNKYFRLTSDVDCDTHEWVPAH